MTEANDRQRRKQRVKQFVRRTIGEPYVGKRVKLRRLERALPDLDLQPVQILDAGCEDAAFTYWLADRWPHAHVTGVDVDAKAIDACNAATPVAYAHRVKFCATAFQNLASSRYDLVVAFDVLEHIDDDAAAVRELARCLRPGGHLLVHVPRDRWIDAHGRATWVPDEAAWKINAGHVRMGYSPAALAEVIRGAELEPSYSAVWLQRWAVRAHWLYACVERVLPLRLLSIPFADLAARLDERRPPEEGNTVFLVAHKPLSETSEAVVSGESAS